MPDIRWPYPDKLEEPSRLLACFPSRWSHWLLQACCTPAWIQMFILYICAQRKAPLITKQRSLKLKSNLVLGAAVNTHEVTFWFGKLAEAEFFLFSIDFHSHSMCCIYIYLYACNIHTKMMKVCIALHCFALYCIVICQMYIYIILHPEELRYSYHFGSGWQRLAILWRLWTPMRARVSTTSCRVLRHFIGAWVFRAANSEVLPRKGPEMVAGVCLACYLYPEVNYSNIDATMNGRLC